MIISGFQTKSDKINNMKMCTILGHFSISILTYFRLLNDFHKDERQNLILLFLIIWILSNNDVWSTRKPFCILTGIWFARDTSGEVVSRMEERASECGHAACMICTWLPSRWTYIQHRDPFFLLSNITDWCSIEHDSDVVSKHRWSAQMTLKHTLKCYIEIIQN